MIRNYLLLFLSYFVLSLSFSFQSWSPKRQELKEETIDCTELYPRLFYRNVTQDNDGYIKLSIKFNTNNECSDSYVYVQYTNSVTKYYCSSTLMNITQNKTFTQYIQTCPIKIKASQKTFKYSCYGNMKSHSFLKNSPSYQVNIPHQNEDLQLVALADWAPIRVRPYTPVYPMLNKMRTSNDYKIHGLMIVGDIAYDLQTNDCQQFVEFMTELSAISPYWPILPIIGNHEVLEPNNEIFFKNFEAGGLQTADRTNVFNFWGLKIVSFDPSYEIYKVSSKEKYEYLRASVLRQIELPADFLILTSHYPLICSQVDSHCRDTLATIPELLGDASKTGKVDLYLGAHMHQYERIYPYVNEQFQINMKSPYKRGLMPSVVEGVAGCDLGIIDADYKAENFSAFHGWNKTGLGWMTFSGISQKNIKLNYKHLVTEPEFMILDQFVIENQKHSLRTSAA